MPKTILKYSCTSFYSKRPKYRTLPIPIWKHKVPNLLMSLKTKEKRGTCFLANGKNSWIVCYRFRNAEIYRFFCPLFSVFGPEPIYQRVSKGDVTILITTLNLYEKSKTISGATSSLRYIILTDADRSSENTIFSTLMSKPQLILKFRKQILKMLLYPFYQWNYRCQRRFTCASCFTHYITGKYVLDFHEGDRFGVLLIRVG
jgi:acetyl-CoA synthetase